MAWNRSQIQRANRTLDLSAWVGYFSRTVMAALAKSERRIEFVIGKARLFERLRGRLNPRQEKVLLRMFAELVALGALHRSGERKHTRYRIEGQG